MAFAPTPGYGAGSMTPDPFRVALFSGNYNYTRDGANQTLNLLVGLSKILTGTNK